MPATDLLETTEKEGIMAHEKNEDELSPQGPVTELSDIESWELLSASTFGHLGLSVDNRPEIFPVDYRAQDAAIVFRTAEGTKLHDLISNDSVVFEADARTESGDWSVVVKGTARVLEDETELRGADLLSFSEWVPTSLYVYVRIDPTQIRGRRFTGHLQAERKYAGPST
ncbi:pyridoxamine 5'-phosphate oxidase family protein [Glaciihabitans sp. UYNi722]|uniref:pyridoxamine 5'-phosphate oxidase family protein n=1 Tax=Glaciihabitans sp. UYNi722 TaxID=3156344 RepID=UPI003393AAC8